MVVKKWNCEANEGNNYFGELQKLDDEALADALKAGRNDALTILFERYHALIFRIARSILRDDGEGEDMVQRVFLDNYQSISLFDSQKGSFKNWLLRYAYTRSINRKEHLTNHLYGNVELDVEMLDAVSSRSSSNAFLPEEAANFIEKALTILNDRRRKIIELTYFEGLTAEEIAEATGDTPSSVRHNLYKGLKELRDVLCRKGDVVKKMKRTSGTLSPVIQPH